MSVQTSEEFNKRFDAISTDVQMLNYYWLTFTGLFWNDEDRTELYTNTAPNALRFLREALLDAIMLRTARLCDPPKTLGHHNLNLRSIAEEPEVAKVAPFKAELDKCLARINPHYEPVKLWRVKRLAHTDLETRLGTEDLPDLLYQHLKELVQHTSCGCGGIERRVCCHKLPRCGPRLIEAISPHEHSRRRT